MKILNEVRYYNTPEENEFEIQDLEISPAYNKNIFMKHSLRKLLMELDQSNKLQITTDTYEQTFTILEK